MPVKLLLVDHNPMDREVIELLLNTSVHDYEFYEAGDILGAQYICERINLDCIILDYNIPDSKPLGCLEKILETTDKKVPIIILTSELDLRLLETAHNMGAIDYKIKRKYTLGEFEQFIYKAINEHIST